MGNSVVFFFNDTPTPEIYTLSLHDALPISSPCAMPTAARPPRRRWRRRTRSARSRRRGCRARRRRSRRSRRRSEEHTSELQSRQYLVCRLLLEKKNITYFHLMLVIIMRNVV